RRSSWKSLAADLSSAFWRNSLANSNALIVSVFWAGVPAGKLQPRCGVARSLHCPAVTKDWDAFTWRRCQQESRELDVAVRALRRLFSMDPTVFWWARTTIGNWH